MPSPANPLERPSEARTSAGPPLGWRQGLQESDAGRPSLPSLGSVGLWWLNPEHDPTCSRMPYRFLGYPTLWLHIPKTKMGYPKKRV